MESRESSSPIVTRSVAAGLADRFGDAYHFSFIQRIALRTIGLFPQSVAQFLIPRAQGRDVPEVKRLQSLQIDHLIRERLRDYQPHEGTYPAITIGAALGGAAAQIALAMGGPFLPQAFVLTLRGGSPKGDAQEYFQRCEHASLELASKYPEVITIQHFDPIHDGWLTKSVNHLRIKLLGLPKLYQDFIQEHLAPGGVVVFLDCGAKWLRYRVGERSFFQVGGWGGIPAEEFLTGSRRIEDYCQRENFSHTSWKLNSFPLEEGAESEWGSEPGMLDVIRKFCQEHGFQFVHLKFPQPHDYSRAAYYLVKKRLEKLGEPPRGILIEMFSQFDSSAVLRSGLLPLWLVFNTHDSLSFLQQMAGEFPEKIPIFFSPLATFSLTPDIVPWDEWMKVFTNKEWFNVGTRATHYPADAWALLAWNRNLRKFGKRTRDRKIPLITKGELEDVKTMITSTDREEP